MMLARSFPKLERVPVAGVARSIMGRQYIAEYGTRVIPGVVVTPDLGSDARNRPTVFAIRKNVECKTIDAQFYGALAHGVLISERSGSIVTDRQGASVGKTYRLIMCTSSGGPLPEEVDEMFHAPKDLNIDADLELRLLARHNYGARALIGKVHFHHSSKSPWPRPEKVYGLTDDVHTGVPVTLLGELKRKQVSVRLMQRKELIPPSKPHAGAATAHDNSIRLMPPPTGGSSSDQTMIDSDVLLTPGVYHGCASEDERYAVKKRENCGLYLATRYFEPSRGAFKTQSQALSGPGPVSGW